MSSGYGNAEGRMYEAPQANASPSPGAAGRPPQRPPRPFRSVAIGCLIAALAGVAVNGLLAVAVVLLLFGSLAAGAGYTGVVREGVQLQEVTVQGEPGWPKVAMIPVSGLLIRGGGVRVGPDPVRVLGAMLAQAREDPDVAAVILSVDSPGGGITTCDAMHKAVQDYKETGNPVLVLMEDVAASGAYYVSCGADHIMAHPTTITGSIGVMMPLYDASQLLKMVGVTDRSVKSGEFKNMGSLFAEKTPEQRGREAEILTGVITEMYDRFVKVVAEGRGLDPAVVRKLADGRIYTSKQAQRSKLIDSIGYREDAIRHVGEMIGAAGVHVVRYARVRSFREMLFLRAQGSDITLRLDRGLLPQSQQRLMYLWTPAVPGPAE